MFSIHDIETNLWYFLTGKHWLALVFFSVFYFIAYWVYEYYFRLNKPTPNNKIIKKTPRELWVLSLDSLQANLQTDSKEQFYQKISHLYRFLLAVKYDNPVIYSLTFQEIQSCYTEEGLDVFSLIYAQQYIPLNKDSLPYRQKLFEKIREIGTLHFQSKQK